METVPNPKQPPREGAVGVIREQVSGSYFDGNTWQLIGYRLLLFLVSAVTLGIAYPWMLCVVQGWEVKHTVIHGRRLKFDGRGHQLIGRYLLWMLLTAVTLGIYGIWFGLGLKKWVVKHTVYADGASAADSRFSGGAGGFLGIHLLAFVLTVFTLGIGKAWADVKVLRWEAKHTHIGGSPLLFSGRGGSLFGKYLLFALLTPLTLGIYALFFTVSYKKWEVKNTEAQYQTPDIQAKARAHEAAAERDYAQFRLAANDGELAALKSGYTGREDTETLERLAGEGNPFAAWRLAELLKGETPTYEGQARVWLEAAAAGAHPQALLELARQLPAEEAIPKLTEAAQNGNAEAAWRLTEIYRAAGNGPQEAYWFKLSLLWAYPEALSRAAEYEKLVTALALRLSEGEAQAQEAAAPGNRALKIAGIGALVLLPVFLLVLVVFPLFFVEKADRTFLGYTLFIEYSGSLQEIPAGDLVLLRPVDPDALAEGDIIAFTYTADQSPDLIRMRKIKAVTVTADGETGFVTYSTALDLDDPAVVPAYRVIGKYEKHSSFYGWFYGSLKRLGLFRKKITYRAELVTPVVSLSAKQIAGKADTLLSGYGEEVTYIFSPRVYYDEAQQELYFVCGIDSEDEYNRLYLTDGHGWASEPFFGSGVFKVAYAGGCPSVLYVCTDDKGYADAERRDRQQFLEGTVGCEPEVFVTQQTAAGKSARSSTSNGTKTPPTSSKTTSKTATKTTRQTIAEASALKEKTFAGWEPGMVDGQNVMKKTTLTFTQNKVTIVYCYYFDYDPENVDISTYDRLYRSTEETFTGTYTLDGTKLVIKSSQKDEENPNGQTLLFYYRADTDTLKQSVGNPVTFERIKG